MEMVAGIEVKRAAVLKRLAAARIEFEEARKYHSWHTNPKSLGRLIAASKEVNAAELAWAEVEVDYGH